MPLGGDRIRQRSHERPTGDHAYRFPLIERNLRAARLSFLVSLWIEACSDQDFGASRQHEQYRGRQNQRDLLSLIPGDSESSSLV